MQDVSSIQEEHELYVGQNTKHSIAWIAKKKPSSVMTWPPSSTDLNLNKNLWIFLKCEIYSEGNQYTSSNSIWGAVVAASDQIGQEQIKSLTDSMDGRLMKVIEKNGHRISWKAKKGSIFIMLLVIFWNILVEAEINILE